MIQPIEPVRTFWVDEARRLHTSLGREQIAEIVGAGTGQLWVDIDSRSEDDWSLLTDVFRFHPLAVEDTRSPDCRVKLEEYDGYAFLVVRGIRFAEETVEPYDIDTHNLYLFIGPNYLVTVHAVPFDSVRTVAERLGASIDLLARGTDHLAYALVDTLVDLYFPLLDRLDDFVDELEQGIFEEDDGEVMQKIFDLKRSLLLLRRHLAPMREVMASVANRPSPYLKQETQIYFRDVYDHVVRQVESIENFRELLTRAMEARLSMISNRMNEIIKVLSVIATVILPPTLIASIYGMNFASIPLAGHPRGFWLIVTGMGLVTVVLLLYLWWKEWL